MTLFILACICVAIGVCACSTMTQIPSTAPLDPPATPPAAPAPDPAPPATPPADNPYIQVQREQFADWNGDTHAALADAKSFKAIGDYAPLIQQFRDAGYSPEQIVAVLNQSNVERPGVQFTPTPPATGVTQEQLTAALQQQATQMQESVAGALKSHGQTQQQDYEQARLQQLTNTGAKLRDDAGAKFVESLGHKLENDDHTPNIVGNMFLKEFSDQVDNAVRARFPETTSQEQADAWAVAGITDADIATANETLKVLADVKYEHAAAVATEQEEVPGATLGEGPGGKTPPSDFDSMNEEQKMDAVMANVAVPPD